VTLPVVGGEATVGIEKRKISNNAIGKQWTGLAFMARFYHKYSLPREKRKKS